MEIELSGSVGADNSFPIWVSMFVGLDGSVGVGNFLNGTWLTRLM